jgi:hypothetical protein
VQDRLTGSTPVVAPRNTTLSTPRSQRLAGSSLAGMETYAFHHCAVRDARGGATAGVDAAVDAVGSRTQPTIALKVSQHNSLPRRPSRGARGTPMSGLQSNGE